VHTADSPEVVDPVWPVVDPLIPPVGPWVVPPEVWPPVVPWFTPPDVAPLAASVPVAWDEGPPGPWKHPPEPSASTRTARYGFVRIAGSLWLDGVAVRQGAQMMRIAHGVLAPASAARRALHNQFRKWARAI